MFILSPPKNLLAFNLEKDGYLKFKNCFSDIRHLQKDTK
jgi:hypothetical protein